ncbi:hypothetical protein T01_13523, partial [Trichinella spiralis]
LMLITSICGGKKFSPKLQNFTSYIHLAVFAKISENFSSKFGFYINEFCVLDSVLDSFSGNCLDAVSDKEKSGTNFM